MSDMGQLNQGRLSDLNRNVANNMYHQLIGQNAIMNRVWLVMEAGGVVGVVGSEPLAAFRTQRKANEAVDLIKKAGGRNCVVVSVAVSD